MHYVCLQIFQLEAARCTEASEDDKCFSKSERSLFVMVVAVVDVLVCWHILHRAW